MASALDRDQTVNLDSIQISNLTTDLSEFATLIDRTLRACNDEPDQQQVQILLSKLALLSGVYC